MQIETERPPVYEHRKVAPVGGVILAGAVLGVLAIGTAWAHYAALSWILAIVAVFVLSSVFGRIRAVPAARRNREDVPVRMR